MSSDNNLFSVVVLLLFTGSSPQNLPPLRLPSLLQHTFINHTIHIINFEKSHHSFEIADNLFLYQFSYIPLVLEFFPHKDLQRSHYNMTTLQNMAIPVKTPLSEFSSHFTGTVVTVIMPDQSQYNQSLIQSLVLETLHCLIASTENPKYVFLHLDAPNLIVLRNIGLQEITLPSKFLVFGRKLKTSLICIPCLHDHVQFEEDFEYEGEFPYLIDEILRLPFEPENIMRSVEGFMDITEIDNLWIELCSNMKESLVRPFYEYAKKDLISSMNIPFLTELKTSSICSMYYSQLSTPELECTVLMLGKKYNYSSTAPIKSELTYIPFGFVNHGPVGTQYFNEMIIISRSPVECSWYNYAVTFHPFNYIIFAEKSSALNITMLLMPFDKWVWICTILALFSMITLLVLLTMETETSNQHRKLSYNDKFFWTISVVCDQIDDGITRRTFQRLWRASPWITIWLFTSFTLGVLYKGSLFSCLTSFVTPIVPQGLPDIVQNNFPIYTLSSVRLVNDFGSMLKSAIMPDLLIGESCNINYFCSNHYDPGHDLGISQEFLQKLNSQILFLPGTNKFEISNNISEGLEVAVEGNKFIQIPKNFALLDSRTEMNDFKEAYLLFMDAIVITGQDLTPFITRIPWYGWRNFFYPIFTQGLGQLVSNGIYDRWIKYNHFHNQRIKLKLLNRTDYDEIFYAKMMAGSKSIITLNEANPVSFQTMKVPFSFIIWVCFAAMIALALEIAEDTRRTLKESLMKRRRKTIVEVFVYVP